MAAPGRPRRCRRRAPCGGRGGRCTPQECAARASRQRAAHSGPPRGLIAGRAGRPKRPPPAALRACPPRVGRGPWSTSHLEEYPIVCLRNLLGVVLRKCVVVVPAPTCLRKCVVVVPALASARVVDQRSC